MRTAVKDRREQGAALLTVLLATTLLLALGGALVQVMTAEAQIAVHHRAGVEAFEAAEALIEWLRAELVDAASVDALLVGPGRSVLDDGIAGPVRIVHGETLDLAALTSVEQCGRAAGCTDAAIRTATADRPWGPNNPRWRLYANGWMHQLTGDDSAAPVYLVAWIGDDPFEQDGDPLRDGDEAGRGRLAVRVRAYGTRGALRELDVVMAGVPGRPHVVRWSER